MPHKVPTAQGPIQARIIIPGSKSITYRALLLAALADGVSELSGLFIDEDIKLFIEALHQVGIIAQLDEKAASCIVAGGNGKFPKKQASLWCGKQKMAAHFLSMACAASPGVYSLDGSTPLRKTSLETLFNLLKLQGAQLIPSDTKQLPFTLIGVESIAGGEHFFDTSSPLISALLITAPFSRSPFNLSVSEMRSKNDIHLTCAMMAEFGVLVHRIHQGQFLIPVPQRYHSRDYTVEPDLALAAYFFAAAAITQGEISIPFIHRSRTKQTEIQFLSILEKMGCKMIESPTGLTLKGPAILKGIEVSLRDVSDTFLALAAIAPFADSPSRITCIGEMSPAEKKRLAYLQQELQKINIHVESGDHWLQISPGKAQSTVMDTHHNRRLAMAFSLIGLKLPGISLKNTRSVLKKHPHFFKLWDELAKPSDYFQAKT